MSKQRWGHIVRGMRKARGWSQAQLAEALQLSKPTISLYENHKRRPEKQAIRTFLRLFKIADEDEKAQLRDWASKP